MDKRSQAIQIVTGIHRTFERAVALTVPPKLPLWKRVLGIRVDYGDGAHIEREYPSGRPYMEALVVPKNTPEDIQQDIRHQIEFCTGLSPKSAAIIIPAGYLVVCFEVRDTRLDTIYGFSVFRRGSASF